jgi:hypothetical protein
MRIRFNVLLVAASWLACEPGTCSPPPPPELGKACKDGADWGICEADGAQALVCQNAVWTRIECGATRCESRGQSFAGRYPLVCGSVGRKATSSSSPSASAP